MGDEQVERGDLEALLAARQELGEAYEPALVDSFAERIERAVAERAESRVSLQAHRQQMEARAVQKQFALGVGSVVASIPISIVLGVTGQLVALLIAWVGIVVVNVAHAMVARPRREE
ncbi:hypothetical protein [Nocardioides donggukensis]|uniref:Uncharacterized protein n=1 Tax=Nocardioides donggukensis TaxID=2774019 RepID=A0A927Q2B9_9ACTN|nr:hypothetical protein [Nocardioides donggukensis]MBD8869521.1 hypothetical protein [Nocardioides donggukensis]